MTKRIESGQAALLCTQATASLNSAATVIDNLVGEDAAMQQAVVWQLRMLAAQSSRIAMFLETATLAGKKEKVIP